MRWPRFGAVLVTVNSAYRQHELGYLLRQGQVRALFTAATYRGNDYVRTVQALMADGPCRICGISSSSGLAGQMGCLASRI